MQEAVPGKSKRRAKARQGLSMKIITICTVLALGIGLVAAPSFGARRTIHMEAEAGQLIDTSVANATSGFRGSGYVTGFTKDDSKVILTCTAPAGLYTLSLRYHSPNGPKGYDLKVNGEGTSGMFDQSQGWAMHTAGKVELKKGANTIEI